MVVTVMLVMMVVKSENEIVSDGGHGREYLTNNACERATTSDHATGPRIRRDSY